MRKFIGTFLSFLLVVAAGSVAPLATAQTPTFPQKFFYASDYGQWQIVGQTSNTYQWSPGTICQVAPTAAGGQFFAFNTNAPVLIIDATPANSEVVTPSAITQTPSFCTITVAPVNSHFSFRVTSATAGLQEVLNQIPSVVAYPVQIVLDRTWYTMISAVTGKTAAGTIAAVVGSQAAIIVDQTTAPYTYYSWNGTNYTPSASNATPPTVAPGAGAGTGPTIALTGTGTSGTVTLTTGTTPTASATIFTLTWPAVSAGGFQYAPNCTITSTGTRAYTGTNGSVAGPPAVDTYTAT